MAKKLVRATWKLLVQPAIQHLLLRPCSKTTEGNETPIGMVATTDASSKMFHAVMTILLEEVLGFHLRPDFFDSSTDIMYALSGCLQSVQGDNSCFGNFTVEEPKYHIGINVLLVPETQKVRTFLQLALPSRVPQQVGNQYYGYQERLFVAKAVIDGAYNDSGMVLEHYKTYNAAVNNPKKYFGSLSDFSPSELQLCNQSRVWSHHYRMSEYAKFSGDYGGVELQPDGSYKATCHDGHWWIAPSCRGSVSVCIPVFTFDDGLLEAMMQWAAAYGMPFGIAQFASRESYENHDPERSRSLFYAWTGSVEFLRFSPEPILLPIHNANEWSQGNQRTAPADHAAAHFASSNLESKAIVVHFLTTLRLEGREIQSLLVEFVELHGSLSQLFADRDGQRAVAVACRWVRKHRARWISYQLGNTTACTNGSGLVDGNGDYVSSRVEAVACRPCSSWQHSEALTDSWGTTFRCRLCLEAPYVAYGGCMCPAGVADLEDLKLFERIL